MPDGIYLNALELGPVKLAKKMFEIISDRKAYHNMFKWHKYYSYRDPQESPDSNGFCTFCALLNNEQKRKERKVYKNIIKWLNENKDPEAAPKRVFEIEVINSIDKNKFEIVNGYDTLAHVDQKRKDSTGPYKPQCSSVMSCAGDYIADLKNKVYDWFRFKPI